MINKIDFEFIQSLNLLYAIPVVAVIFCAIIVYAVGFKTPVQPPSFDGIEEEKKLTKKKKTKDSSKSKLLQNGKANGTAVLKNQSPPNKKKENSEKRAPVEKPVPEKPVVNEKKANKKNKQQNEKQNLAEKKKEVAILDDVNDDGWVQLVSKKGRKNRKKDDATTSENLSNKSSKTVDVNKSDDSSQVDDSPKSIPQITQSSAVVEEKQVSTKVKKGAATKEIGTLKEEKNQEQVLIVEVIKSEVNDFQKLQPEENIAKEAKVLEETSSKSKKKKKKASELVKEKNDANTNVSEKTSVQIITDIPTSEEKITSNIIVTSDHKETISGNTVTDKSSDAKASNVAFDELAGLYPEAKEQKKKKKVRRDH
ncbi:probable replication factor C subunit 1 [Uloborus diversus]|uniref:probable replication factor C subunit 1 n=1 Tax=Uloborus diversus TaxID=327109 RepID=UPI00240A6403|nr:probable replication factor C subunit 1 [Uloborus diversus]